MRESQSIKLLGGKLKAWRMQRHESVDEVSGAVEIDAMRLKAIEAGAARPDEEILVLLMSHFEIDGRDAEELWALAGYSRDDSFWDTPQGTTTDGRIFYTDLVHITSNKNGVVINFLQQESAQKATVVSRLGMSTEHAEAVLEVLQRALKNARATNEPKLLPPATDKKRLNSTD